MKTRISPMARIYGNLETGDNCRIDDFVIITGNVKLGNHVHIGAHSMLLGSSGGIVIEDYAGMSCRVSIFTGADDYASGDSLIGPCIPDEFKPGLVRGPIRFQRHAHVGAHSVVLPGVTIGEGTCVGALSLVKHDLDPWGIYAGVPAKRIRERSNGLLRLEVEYERSLGK